MSQILTVPRSFGGTLLVAVTIIVIQQVPGVATLSDGLHGAASIQDMLVDRATAGDVSVGSVALSDQA